MACSYLIFVTFYTTQFQAKKFYTWKCVNLRQKYTWLNSFTQPAVLMVVTNIRCGHHRHRHSQQTCTHIPYITTRKAFVLSSSNMWAQYKMFKRLPRFKTSKQMYSLSRASFSLLLPQRQPPMCALALQKRLQTKVSSTDTRWIRINERDIFKKKICLSFASSLIKLTWAVVLTQFCWHRRCS